MHDRLDLRKWLCSEREKKKEENDTIPNNEKKYGDKAEDERWQKGKKILEEERNREQEDVEYGEWEGGVIIQRRCTHIQREIQNQ